MKEYKVAVLGATGAVGQEMLKILAERRFPVSQVRALASARSAGKRVYFAGETLPIEEATAESFKGMDIVLGAVGAGAARAFASGDCGRGRGVRRQLVGVPHGRGRAAGRSGDQPGGRAAASRRHREPELLYDHHHGGGERHSARVADSKRWSRARIRRFPARARAGIDGAGSAGRRGCAAARKVEPTHRSSRARLRMNVIPHDRRPVLENGYTTEEMKMQNEGRKILHNAGMNA